MPGVAEIRFRTRWDCINFLSPDLEMLDQLSTISPVSLFSRIVTAVSCVDFRISVHNFLLSVITWLSDHAPRIPTPLTGDGACTAAAHSDAPLHVG